MRQASLFDDFSEELTMLMVRIKTAMNRSATQCGLSRDEIADCMNEIAAESGVSLTRGNANRLKTTTLEKWLNPTNIDHQPSMAAVNVFCRVVKSIAPLEPMLGLHGCGVMTPDDRKKRDYADALLAERKARKRKRQLEMDL